MLCEMSLVQSICCLLLHINNKSIFKDIPHKERKEPVWDYYTDNGYVGQDSVRK